MKFKVEKIKQAEKEYNSLTSSQKELLDEDYAKVENEGLERVSTKQIKPQNGLNKLQDNE